jgi:hypothetical protein
VVPATTVFCLVTREVCLALDVLDERLEKQLEWIFISLTYHGERMPGSVLLVKFRIWLLDMGT